MNDFTAMHIPGAPLGLWNIWDAGSARAVATGSVSVAGAMGYPDGQELPLDLLQTICRRIAVSVPVPLSVGFESGYAEDPGLLAENAAHLAETDAQGCNFEDGIPPEAGIRALAVHLPRIRALRQGAPKLFLNARTDLFLQNPAAAHGALLPEALERARLCRCGGGWFLRAGPGRTYADRVSGSRFFLAGQCDDVRGGPRPSGFDLAGGGADILWTIPLTRGYARVCAAVSGPNRHGCRSRCQKGLTRLARIRISTR